MWTYRFISVCVMRFISHEFEYNMRFSSLFKIWNLHLTALLLQFMNKLLQIVLVHSESRGLIYIINKICKHHCLYFRCWVLWLLLAYIELLYLVSRKTDNIYARDRLIDYWLLTSNGIYLMQRRRTSSTEMFCNEKGMGQSGKRLLIAIGKVCQVKDYFCKFQKSVIAKDWLYFLLAYPTLHTFPMAIRSRFPDCPIPFSLQNISVTHIDKFIVHN
jgi:hypothetical protein